MRIVGACVVAAMLAGACGGGKGSSAAATSTTASSPASTVTTTGAGSASTSATTVAGSTTTAAGNAGDSGLDLPNGTVYVYIVSAQPAAKTVTFDVVQNLDRHSAAAKTVCPEIASGDIDGYCIANASTRLRTFSAAAATVKILPGDGTTQPKPSTLSGLKSHLNPTHREVNFYKLTVAGGAITAIEEIFVP